MEPQISFQPDDVLVPLDDHWTTQSQYWVRKIIDRLFFTHVSGHNWANGDIKVINDIDAPDPGTVFIKPRKGSSHETLYLQIQAYISQRLSYGPKSLDRLLTELNQSGKFDDKFIAGCVRVMVAEQDLLAEEDDGRVILRLSADAKEIERRRAYVAGFACELAIQASQIGLLIGHKPTVGSYREDLLRNLLALRLPKRFHVATGFIAGISSQIDILIYDQIDFAPLFRAGDLVVVPASAVRAIIEVKSYLDATELKKALNHLLNAKPDRRGGPPIFTGIFAYDGATAPTLMKGWKAYHNMDGDGADPEIDSNAASEDDSEMLPDPMRPISDLGSTVTAICILQQSILLSAFVPTVMESYRGVSPAIVQLESFAKKKSEAAVFFDVLSRHLRHPIEGPLVADGISASVQVDLVETTRMHAYDELLWGPYMTRDLPALKYLKESVKAYERWLNGEIWKRSSHLDNDC